MIADARKTRGIIRRDTRANQPAATDVLWGTLYYVTDEGIIERSNGVAWESYSSTGTPPTIPAGVDTQVQFNDGGVFGADVGFTYNKTSNTLFAQNHAGQVNGFTINQAVSWGSTPFFSGELITNLQEANIADGSLLARLAANETISGLWTLNQVILNDQVSLNDNSFFRAAPVNGYRFNNAANTVRLLTILNGGGVDIPIGNFSIAGGMSLTGALSNLIHFGTPGVAPPSFSTRSAGTKIVFYPAITAGSVDYAMGIDGAVLWFSVPASDNTFKFYAGTTVGLQITGTGALQFSASVAGPPGASICYNSTNGVMIRPYPGIGYDFSIVNPANSNYILNVPTGTPNIQIYGNIHPSVTNTQQCGTSALAWSHMYAYLAPQPSAPAGKIDIERSKLGLNFINALIPVQYRYTTRTSEQLRQGFLSTDVERIITEDIPTEFGGLVKSEEGPEHDALAYTEFIAPLVKAVQELSTLVTTLTEELVTLRARVTALESPR